MLSDETINKLVERIVKRIQDTNVRILQDIGESINKIGTLTPTKANQLINILKYGGDYDKIVKELSKVTKLNIKDIDQIFHEVAKSDYRFAKQFYDYRKVKYVPFDENSALKQQVEAVERSTIGKYLNISQTTMLGYKIKDRFGNIGFKTIRETYYELIDSLVLSVSEGKETFQDVLRVAIESIGESGLRVVYPTTYISKDKNGQATIKLRTRRLDSVIRMNINDGLNELHNKSQEIMGEQFGANGVEVTAHINPAKDHEKLQGHMFTFEEYEKLNNGKRAKTYDGLIIEANEHRRPVSTMNCRHYEYRVVLEVQKQNYSNEDLDKILKMNEKGFKYNGKHYTNYEGTQLQRQLELKILQERDKIAFAEKINDPKVNEIIEKCNNKIRMYKKKRKEIQKLLYS